MNKIKIIIIREYLTRVRSKVFILSTLLMPLLMGLIIFLPIMAGSIAEDGDFTIYVQDKSGIISEKLSKLSSNDLKFIPVKGESKKIEADILRKERSALLIIPKDLSYKQINVRIKSAENVSIQVMEKTQSKVRSVLRDFKLEKAGLSQEQLDEADFKLSMNLIKLSDKGDEEEGSVLVSAIVGYAMSFLIYIFMFIYGAQVMRGVIEEKTNRIVEVIVSSVKPFQLMMGKILGIALVGLTQFLIWTVLIIGIVFIGSLFMSTQIDPAQMQQASQASQQVSEQQIQSVISELKNFDFSLIFFFIYYFLGGYFIYGSLFAAVGSAVDQESDAQQLTLPITLPLIVPMMFLANILQAPNGTLAKIFSIFPLFSPVTMMIRLAGGEVQWYELAASMILLFLTFLGAVWFAAKVYRTGILMYGQKPSLKKIIKWAFWK